MTPPRRPTDVSTPRTPQTEAGRRLIALGENPTFAADDLAQWVGLIEAEARAAERDSTPGAAEVLDVLLNAVEAAIDNVAEHQRLHGDVPYQVAEAMQRLSRRHEAAAAYLASIAAPDKYHEQDARDLAAAYRALAADPRPAAGTEAEQ